MAAKLNDTIIGIYFFEENLTLECYMQFLRIEVTPVLANMLPNAGNPNLPDDSTWLQKDGAYTPCTMYMIY